MFKQALVTAIIRDCGLGSMSQQQAQQVALWLGIKLIKMPWWMSMPLNVLTIIFQCHSFCYARSFQSLSFERQRDLLNAWRHSPVMVCQRWLMFMEKITVFIFLSSEHDDA